MIKFLYKAFHCLWPFQNIQGYSKGYLPQKRVEKPDNLKVKNVYEYIYIMWPSNIRPFLRGHIPITIAGKDTK